MAYPKRRNLDGVYFRMKRYDNYDEYYENLCFTDLTQNERDRVTAGRDLTWYKNMLFIMVNRLREIGDELDLEVCDEES